MGNVSDLKEKSLLGLKFNILRTWEVTTN